MSSSSIFSLDPRAEAFIKDFNTIFTSEYKTLYLEPDSSYSTRDLIEWFNSETVANACQYYGIQHWLINKDENSIVVHTKVTTTARILRDLYHKNFINSIVPLLLVGDESAQ